MMKKEYSDWIKLHQGVIKDIITDRMHDYFNKVVDEPDLQRKEVLSLLVKEFRMALVAIENIAKGKDSKKPDEEWTGV